MELQIYLWTKKQKILNAEVAEMQTWCNSSRINVVNFLEMQ